MARTVVSLKVTLRDSKPPIWRRLLMPGAMTLHDLHEAIQAAMGWDGGHLHAFELNGTAYGDPEAGEDFADSSAMTLDRMVKSGTAKFTYTYDFGDDWEHSIVVEKPQPVVPGQFYPACVAGKRACPPEDCGGMPGYEALLATGNSEFDPEDFSVEDADTMVAGCFDRQPG
ncbi:MAG: plasmid pRiA4b ORF-3 family protein [Rhodospirillales bacterium]